MPTQTFLKILNTHVQFEPFFKKFKAVPLHSTACTGSIAGRYVRPSPAGSPSSLHLRSVAVGKGLPALTENSGKNKKGFFLINLQEQLPQPSVSTNSVNKIILHINYNQKFHEVQFINFFSFFPAILTQKPF